MIKANVLEAKTRLSEYVERAARGERVVICRHNKPVAELRALEAGRTTARPTGPLPERPTFEVPASFFEPMSEEDLALWEGGVPFVLPPSGRVRRSRAIDEKPSRGRRRGRRAR